MAVGAEAVGGAAPMATPPFGWHTWRERVAVAPPVLPSEVAAEVLWVADERGAALIELTRLSIARGLEFAARAQPASAGAGSAAEAPPPSHCS